MYKVISSNIRFESPNDKHQPWAERKTVLGKIFNQHLPDILGTQEGRQDQLIDFYQEVKSFLTIVDNHRDWITERMYPTLFLNFKKLELLQSGDVWLSETPYVPGSQSFGSAFPRLATWARVSDKNTRQNYCIVNTHLDHVLTQVRAKQIEVLLTELKSIKETNDQLILMGDFNEPPNGKVYRAIMSSENNIVDPWVELNNTEETSYHKFKGKLDTGARIDWIFTDKNIKYNQCELLKDREGDIWPSDHFPVFLS